VVQVDRKVDQTNRVERTLVETVRKPLQLEPLVLELLLLARQVLMMTVAATVGKTIK